MKLLSATLACGIALTLATGVDAGGLKRIKKEKDFRSQIVGKKLTVSSGWVKINPDGTSRGKFGSDKWKGVWQWSKGYYCSAGMLGKKERPSDCFLTKSDGTTMQLTNKKGKGDRTTTWTIE